MSASPLIGSMLASDDSTVVEAFPWHGCGMVTCCIHYVLDPHRLPAFEEYANRWPPIIERNGGALVGYFLPKEGPNNVALALVEFESLADYEVYRQRLAADEEAQANVAHARDTRCILVETRSFLRRGAT
jgi:hypothetical protein